jgi:hypothetical protein
MTPNAIFLPVAVLALWTLAVLLLIPIKRFAATAKGQVTADDFKLGESSKVPEDVRLPNRNLMNLLEIPLLFYVACISLFVTGHVDQLMLWLAWAYVALRVLHSLIHLMYNNVFHRLGAYALSNFVVVAMWIYLLLALA